MKENNNNKQTHYEQLNAIKLGNMEEIDAFLETYKLPKLKQEEIETLHRPITSNEIETVIRKLPRNKNPGPDGFLGEFYQHLKKK